MAGYKWYKTGSVVVRNGDVEVVGANTGWLVDDIKQGDIFFAGGQIYEIDEVIGNTSLKLTTPYEGISNAAADYAIITRAGEVLQAEIALMLQQAVIKMNSQDSVITALKEHSQVLTDLGLYVDGDGDLAQGQPGTTGGSSAPTLTSLPIASRTQAGIVRVGNNLDVTSEGTISANVDKGLIQESLEQVAATPADMNAMIDEVYSDNSGS
mgnify:CR=1 FL=1